MSMLVRVKKEKVETQARLQQAEADAEDVDDDYRRQVLFTDFLQTKIDELKVLAESAGANKHDIDRIIRRTCA